MKVVVVGAGPNGLSAAVRLAEAGLEVVVLEAADAVGGAARSRALTLPGFVHDVCSAVHPLGLASPWLRTLPLQSHGLAWVQPPFALAHPLDDGTAAVAERSLSATAERLGRDGGAYRRLIAPLAREWRPLFEEILAPVHVPRHPLLLARFGLRALQSGRSLAQQLATPRGRALVAGAAAHSILSLDEPLSGAYALVLLVAAHAVGWPMPQGGAQSLSNALAGHLASVGGTIVTGRPVGRIGDLPDHDAVLLDVTPRQALAIAGERFSPLYRRRLGRYRYGAGVFKVDWAMSAPIPWRAPDCREAGTIHVGGTLEEVAAAESEVAAGRHPERPFVLVVQPSLFDSTRAPEGRHTAWAYCHVPHGSTLDQTRAIEAQIERFAPGFGDVILARHTRDTAQMAADNANCVGGDISGGRGDLAQALFRPLLSIDPYRTSDPRIFLASSSTPPGGGVHGMCGYHAAESALRALRVRR